MTLAQKNFTKYQIEFHATTKEEMPSSPTSTAPDVYTSFPKDGSSIANVNYLYERVPHLQDLWPSSYEPGRTRIEEVVQVPSYLLTAFPEQPPEDRPIAFYYTEDRTKVSIPFSVRSSHGVGPHFMPPLPSFAPSRRGRLQTRSESPVRRGRAARSPTAKEKATSKVKEASTLLDAGKAQISRGTGLLSPDTRFKNSEDLLIPSSPRDTTFATAVPSRWLPDPLRGMASSGRLRPP
jgi:hypothetical protein